MGKGKGLGTSILEESLESCEKNEDTCCNNIGYGSTCSWGYNAISLCQLSCCCRFPNADCCQQIFNSRKTVDATCDFVEFCAQGEDAAAPTAAPTVKSTDAIEKIEFNT